LLFKYILALCIIFSSCFCQTVPFYVKAEKLIGTFNRYHLSPITLNEKTSSEIVDIFVAELDNKAFFIKERDQKNLKQNSGEFLNQISAQTNGYYEIATAIYLQSLKTTDSILTLISKKPLDFNENDTAYLLPYADRKVFYSPSIKYHLKRIERYVKLKCYEKVVSTDNYDKLTETEFNARAQGFSKAICVNFQKQVGEEMAITNSYVESTLLNSIALRHDPHSNYFTEKQNQQFKNQLSTEIESFGFYVNENDEGIIIIDYIEPGGSAWMCNEINEGDVFISIKIGRETINGEELNAFEIQTKLNDTKEKEIILTVKKRNGSFKTIKLIKQKTASLDNSVKGYLLSDAHSKIGYICLPSFYTDMEQHNLPGCANDVAKEILKLEKDTINGLILDLRNNGGGSMEEAMNLAGIFIDEGPLFIMKEKNKKPSLIKDINRGAIFKKPLVILINETSASASELFANIAKDYNIGIVVGQTSYGKGTAQVLLPLDTNLLTGKNTEAIKNNSDFIKVTYGKFYRLNCSTHQGNGVIPDIQLPSAPGYKDVKENKEYYHLPADSITKKVMYTPNPQINFQLLQANSAKRISSSPDFKQFTRISDSVSNTIYKTQAIVLKFKEYKEYNKKTDAAYDSMEKAFDSSNPSITCKNNSFDLKLEDLNEQTKEFNLRILQSLQKDIFIAESFNIINDFINQQKK
jgi:carboxyl-terminal processing protease